MKKKFGLFLYLYFLKYFVMEVKNWKAKSLERTKENKELKKRIIELKTSRDLWKEKSFFHKSRCTNLENSLKKKKNLIEKIVFQDI